MSASMNTTVDGVREEDINGVHTEESSELPKPSVYFTSAYLIKGTLQETAFDASPYSYFSLTRKYGLREVWDEDHVKYYKDNTKHCISAYAKPLALYRCDGSNVVRIELDCGVTRIVDIDTFLLVEEPELVVKILAYALGFPVDMRRAALFCRAMQVARLEPELPKIPDFVPGEDTFPLVGTQIFQKYKGMIVNTYTGSEANGDSGRVRDGIFVYKSGSEITGSGIAGNTEANIAANEDALTKYNASNVQCSNNVFDSASSNGVGSTVGADCNNKLEELIDMEGCCADDVLGSESVSETDTEKLARIMAMKPDLIIHRYMKQCSETLVFGKPFDSDQEC